MPDFELFRYFQDGMILQRNREVSVWGFAERGTHISLMLDDTDYQAVAGDNGEFEFIVTTGEAGGPHSMTVYNESGKVIIEDILYGDVYMISGQSNMQLPIERTIDLIGERLPDIDYPMIREFRVPELAMFGQTNSKLAPCSWYKAVSDDIMFMSATGFNFAESIYRQEGIPIGLINNSIGGTPIEAHLPEDILHRIGGYDEELAICKDAEYVNNTIDSDIKAMNTWSDKLYQEDPGVDGDRIIYAQPDYDDSEWSDITIPVFFGDTDIGDYHGSIWFRKEFDIPEDYDISGVMLRLGTMIDSDTVYLNGVKVGETGYMYPPRRYMLEDGILKTGRNVVTIRLVVNRNTGGFTPDKRYCLQGKQYIYEGGYTGQAAMPDDANPSSGRWEIDLSGTWRYRYGAGADVLPMQTFFIYKPSALYNGMMHPLKRCSCVGGLWYQGESNDSNPKGYAELMKLLIGCWREWFGENLPFFYVGLPQFDDPARMVPENSWAEIRYEQQKVLSELDNVAMAVTIDVGEANDLHPQTKESVGKRLALAAEAMIYGKDIEYSGPVLVETDYNPEDSTLTLSFGHCSGGLKIVNDNQYFEIGYADNDNKKDIIDVYDNRINWSVADGYKPGGENELILQTNGTVPVAVRYCFSNCPSNPPVYNGAGLPAIPFVSLIDIS